MRTIRAVNETIAHHAAWTEERFEGVEERLGGLELGQQTIVEAIGGLTIRVGNIETAHVTMHAEMGRMESRILGRMDQMHTEIRGDMDQMRIEIRGDMDQMRIEIRGDMDQMRTEIRGDIDKLAVRMDRVISFAVKDELKLAEIMVEEEDDKS